MSDTPAPESNETKLPKCPFRFTVDLLRFIGSLRGDPDLVGYVDILEVMHWVSVRINELVGLSDIEVHLAIARLARRQALTGNPPGGYGGFVYDLNHIARELRQADKDGFVVQLWREMCRKWSIFAKANRAVQEQQGDSQPEVRSEASHTRKPSAEKPTIDTTH
jgi:hypothetical protein